MSMTTPDFQLLDINALLQPIPGPNEAGTSLFYDLVYSTIREARRFDDPRAPKNPFEIKTADWKKVVALTTSVLTNQSKDVQLAVWLTEALTRQHGFSGLEEGLAFLTAILDRFWDSFFPLREDENLEARANVLDFLNSPQMLLAIREIPLLPKNRGESYSYEHWTQSQRYAIPDNLNELENEQKAHYESLREDALKYGIPSKEQWQTFEVRIRPEHINPTYQILNRCLEQTQTLARVVSHRFQYQAISFQPLLSTLENIQLLVKRLNKEYDTASAPPSSGLATGPLGFSGQPGGGGRPAPMGSLTAIPVAGELPFGRKEALTQLRRLAEFFRATEPHSPVSYLVQRAVKWGEASLEDVLGELIKNEEVLDHVRETLGIQGPQS